MIEEVGTNLYRIEIPLPRSPLKTLNSYVIRGAGRNLMIDTGWNQQQCLDAMQAGCKKLGIDIEETDFFITHIHTDHLGLVSSLVTDTSKIYFNQPEGDRIKAGITLDDFMDFARLNGFPEKELARVPHAHPGFKFRAKGPLNFHYLKEGDTLRVSDYVFHCVETPGHSKGHLCLYEPSKKIFVAGDHILGDITPTITSWFDEWNPLKEYLESLDKVDQLDIELVLPGHREVIRNARQRIQELKDHHRERLNEIITILEKGSKNAFQVASRMTWDITYDSWELFPVSQKWFAMGEAISHLKYLEEKGVIHKEFRQGKRVYFVKDKDGTKRQIPG